MPFPHFHANNMGAQLTLQKRQLEIMTYKDKAFT